MGLLNIILDHPVITVFMIVVAINVFGHDDAPEKKAAVEVGVVAEETLSVKEAAKGIIDDVKVIKEALTEKALKAIRRVDKAAPEEKTKEPVTVEKEKPKKDKPGTATLDDPYGKIGSKY